jgi:DNA-binding beta-propeller fold protein YncE
MAAATLGCVGGRPPVAEAPIFYPATQPRVQFLTGFSDADAWAQRHSSFAQFIVGTPQTNGHEIVSPYGLAVRDGRMYICDLGAHRVHVIDMAAKTYSALGTPQQVVNPVHVTIAPDGTKYVCDTDPKRKVVVVFDAQDRFVRDMTAPQGGSPIDLALWKDNLVVADVEGGRVQVWTRDGQFVRDIAGHGDGPADLHRPTNLAIGPDGLIFVTDTDLQVVKVYDQDGHFVRSIGQPGDRPGNFARPKGIAVDPEERVYVADAQWDVIQLFTAEGQILLNIPEQPAEAVRDALELPAGLTIDSSSLSFFKQFVAPDFVPEYLLFVANQFGRNRVGVYAFGHAQGAPAQ